MMRGSGSDSKLQQQILKSIHSDSSGRCHLGRDKTREKRENSQEILLECMMILICLLKPVSIVRRSRCVQF